MLLILLTLAGAFSPARAEDGAVNKVVFRCLGDFVIHEKVYQAAQTAEGGYDFRPMLAPVADLIGDADYTVANVEGVMGASDVYSGYPRFSTPIELMDALQDAGVDMLTMANNHSLDCDFEGLVAQMDACDARGMDYIGAARSAEDKRTPQIREINGIRIGFLNYTTNINGRDEAKANRDTASFSVNNIFTNSNFDEDAQALRDAGAEAIVAFMHWGVEYQRTPHSEQEALTARLVRAGVDVIVGCHPHVIQRCYWREGVRNVDGQPQRTLMLYSMGNFLSNQRSRYQNCGIIFEFTLEKDADGKITVHSPGYIPVYVWCEETKTDCTYQVLATERYLDAAPEGMSKEEYARMKLSWSDTVAYLGTAASAVECIHVQ